MSAVDGQLSIFDELVAQDPDRTTCPYCHFSWAGRTSLALQTTGSNGWGFGASEAGRCENQKIFLFRVGAQSHFGLRLTDDEPNVTYRHDLLGVILEAKQHGCTDKQIQKVLTKTRK